MKGATGKFGRISGGRSDAVGPIRSERGSEVFLAPHPRPGGASVPQTQSPSRNICKTGVEDTYLMFIYSRGVEVG